MQIDAKSAEASLADINVIVARLKQSSFYRAASALIIVWGALVAFGYVASSFVPRQAGLIWVTVNGLGLIATIATGLQYRRKGAEFDWRIVIAIVLFFAFGLVSCRMGHFGWREISVFWPILFMFGYALAGLWFGAAFSAIGLGLTALILMGYLWSGAAFPLWLAVVTGFGFILCGLWMRRA